MLRRNARGSFPDAVVFPGGVVEDSDRDASWDALVTGTGALTRDQVAIRIAGIRETWEEVGILTCHTGPVPDPAERERAFIDVVRSTGGSLALDGLHYFARWVTPEVIPRRFDTRFYLARMPAGQDAIADGGEAVSIEWLAPSEALDRATSGSQPLMFPTRLNLQRLADSADAAAAIADAAARERFVVRPVVRTDEDGVVLSIPEAAGYGPAEDRMPR